MSLNLVSGRDQGKYQKEDPWQVRKINHDVKGKVAPGKTRFGEEKEESQENILSLSDFWLGNNYWYENKIHIRRK